MSSRPRAHLLLSLAVACAMIATSPAIADDSPSSATRSVKRSGSCSGPTKWTLVLRAGDPGDLVVIFTAQGGASGQRWNIFMDDNGKGFFSGTRTSGTGGWFRVRTVTRNRAGADKIVVAASNSKTGETCAANARF